MAQKHRKVESFDHLEDGDPFFRHQLGDLKQKGRSEVLQMMLIDEWMNVGIFSVFWKKNWKFHWKIENWDWTLRI